MGYFLIEYYQYWNPFIHPFSMIEDAPTEYLFPRSGGRFTGIRDRKRLWSKDNDPVARTRTEGKKKKGKKETRHGDLRANGWRRKMVGTMFHLARTFIVRAL